MIYQDDDIQVRIMRASGIKAGQIQALVVLREKIRRGGVEDTKESGRLKFEQWLAETGRYADDKED